MEINVTKLVNEDNAPMLSGSVFELGEDAGRITWNNSKDYAASNGLLTLDQIEPMKEYFRGFGAWSKEEIAAWTEIEVQALFVQEVASNIREMESFDTYEDYQAAVEKFKGQASGNLFKSENEWFFYAGY